MALAWPASHFLGNSRAIPLVHDDPLPARSRQQPGARFRDQDVIDQPRIQTFLNEAGVAATLPPHSSGQE
jgi:hypothetical protein